MKNRLFVVINFREVALVGCATLPSKFEAVRAQALAEALAGFGQLQPGM